jgi:hypothetical protein
MDAVIKGMEDAVPKVGGSEGAEGKSSGGSITGTPSSGGSSKAAGASSAGAGSAQGKATNADGAGKTSDTPKSAGDADDLGALTKAANDLRLAREAAKTEETKLATEKDSLSAAQKDFETKVTQTKETYKAQILTGSQVEALRKAPFDPAGALRFIYGDNIDLIDAQKTLNEDLSKPITAADLRRVHQEAKDAAKADVLSELEKRQEAEKTKATETARAATEAEITGYKKAADTVMAATATLLEGDEYPNIKARLQGLEMGYTENFVQSDGKKVLTVGDKLLTILNEQVRKDGKPQPLPVALKELEDSFAGKPQGESPAEKPKQAAGKPNGTKVPSSSQRAGAGTRAPNDPKAKDFVEREWADLIEDIRSMEAAARK